MQLSKPLETARLRLEPITAQHSSIVLEGIKASINELRQFPSTMAWSVEDPSQLRSNEYCLSAEHLRLAGKEVVFVVRKREAPYTFCGVVGLHAINWKVVKCELGFWGATPTSRTGYLTEAVKACLDYALFDLGAKRVYAVCDSQNARAIAVCERSGMVREGLLMNDRREPLSNALRHMALLSVIA